MAIYNKPKKKKKAKASVKKATRTQKARGTWGSGGPVTEPDRSPKTRPPGGTGGSRENPGGDSMGSARSTIVVNPGSGGGRGK